jgi:hypothetical protein
MPRTTFDTGVELRDEIVASLSEGEAPSVRCSLDLS